MSRKPFTLQDVEEQLRGMTTEELKALRRHVRVRRYIKLNWTFYSLIVSIFTLVAAFWVHRYTGCAKDNDWPIWVALILTNGARISNWRRYQKERQRPHYVGRDTHPQHM